MSTVKAISGIGEIPEDFLESAFNCRIQAFKNSGQQTVKKYDKELLFLMKKDCFLKTWEAIPILRLKMFEILCYAMEYKVLLDSDFFFTTRDAEDVSIDLFEKCAQDTDYISSVVRASLSAKVGGKDSRFKIQPMQEVARLREMKASAVAINHWIELAIPLISRDEDYEELYNSIQKAEGYTVLKNKIIDLSFTKKVIMYDVLDKIADSSPVSLKRTAIENISAILADIQNAIAIKGLKPNKSGYYDTKDVPFCTLSRANYLGFDSTGLPKSDLSVLKSEEFKAQELMKKFIGAEDAYCMQKFCEHLSLDSLAWLLPNIAKHKSLVDFVNLRIDKNVGPRAVHLGNYYK